MTLSNIGDSSVDKGFFAKISVRKLVDLVAHSGSIRKVVLSDFVESIEVKNLSGYGYSTPTQVWSYAELTGNGKFYWDRDNQTLYVYYSDSLPKKIIVIVAIFVTTTFDVLQVADLENSSNPHFTVWFNRLQETSFTQSIEDQLNGKIGISTTNISLINNDSFYNYLASDEYTFKNCAVKVWVIINDFSNRVIVFRGVTQNYSFSGSTLNLDVIEQTKAYQQDASFGDISNWIKINKTKFPDSKDEDQGKYIPSLLYTKTANHVKKSKGRYENGGNEYSEFEFYDVDPEKDLQGIYIGSSGIGETSAYKEGKKYVVCKGAQIANLHRRAISLCPTIAEYFYTSDITDIYLDITPRIYSEWKVDLSDATTNYINFVYTGMLIWLQNVTTADTYEMIVTKVDTVNNTIQFRYQALVSTTANIHTASEHQFRIKYRGPTVYTIKDGVPVYLNKLHYWFSQSNDDGVGTYNQYLTVTYDYSLGYVYPYYFNNMINSWDLYPSSYLPTTINEIPDIEYFVRYVPCLGTDLTAWTLYQADVAQQLHYIMYSVKDIPTDSTATTALSFPSSGTCFNDMRTNMGTSAFVDAIISQEGEDNLRTYIDVLERILFSIFGFTVTDTAGRRVVKLFENIPYNSNILDLTEDDIKDSSVSSNIDSTDMATEIKGNSKYSFTDPFITEANSDSEILNGNIRYNFDHYIASNAVYRDKVKDRLEAYKYAIIKKYSFTIINKGYELIPSDRITIRFDNSGKWLGSDTVKNLFIVKVNKSLSGVVVDCIENIFA